MKFYNWKQDAIRDGKGFHIDAGAFSTPIVGGGDGTVIEITEPEAIIGVPSGTSIIPIRINVVCQTPLIAADSNESEILIAVNIAAVPTSYGTATAETAINMMTGHTATSLCTCKSANTADCTSPTLGLELAHAVKIGDVQGTAANALWGDLVCLYEPDSPPILVGPCALFVYFGGTVATSGFAQIEWLEYTTTDLT